MKSPTPAKLIAVHILGLGSLFAMPANATLISNYLTVNGSADAGNSADTDAFGPSSDTGYVTGYAYASDSANSNSSASAWGNEYGVYRADASGSGVFNGSGHFHKKVTLTNDNGYLTDYSLNFFIYYGSISVQDNGVDGTGWGSYDLSIKLNGTDTLFASHAKLESDGTLTRTGTELDGAYHSGDYYYWNGTYVDLDLGTLGIGESLTLDFDLVSTAFGDFGFSDSNCYGGYGGTVATFSSSGYGGYGGCTGTVNAGLGDPGDYAENGQDNPFLTITGVPTNSVPLPGTLALFGIGLAGLGWSKRKLRR